MGLFEDIASARRMLKEGKAHYDGGEYIKAATSLDAVVKICVRHSDMRHGSIHATAQALRNICREKGEPGVNRDGGAGVRLRGEK